MFQTLLIGLFVLLVATVLYLRNQLASKRPKDNTIGFFHPYCNDGGGGERVLWCAVKSLQELNSSTKIVIFTGYDPNFTGDQIVARARERFNIAISRPVEFVFLKRRWLVEDKTYPRFTLLGQSLGSMLLCWEAINNVNPHVYIDTMGYAFTNLVVRLFTNAKIACYVHYPTISTDMLQVVQNQQNTFNNDVASSTLKTKVKLVYYKLFAAMYSFAGARSELVMVNSTWTKNHILDLWKIPKVTHRLYPPCNTSELKTIPLGTREKYIISIGQFRREKDHPLQIKAFHRFLQKYPQYQGQVKLALIGSIRNNEDQGRVDNLKSLAKELKVQDDVEFCINVPFPELKRWLSRAMIGVHTMWNEHFGIGVVEFMAAGVIPVAHNSAGPKEDIVIEYNKGLTGFLATTAEEFADGFERVLALSEKERRSIQENARESTDRFSDEAFAENFKGFMKPFLQ